MPELDPKGIYGRNITDYEEKFTSLVNRLLEETDAEDASL